MSFFIESTRNAKFLLSRRRDAEATQLTWLTETSFARIDSTIDASEAELRTESRSQALVSSLNIYGSVCLVLLWSVMGLTFVLHQTYIGNYLAAKGVAQINATTASRSSIYSRYLYTIPGPLVATILIEVKGLGRKRTGAGIAILTGLFMLLATLARSRNSELAFECIISFLCFAGMATLILYTVEVLPTTVRGFGLGVMGFFWGKFGLIAYIITTFDSSAVSGGGPVWFCGAVWSLKGAAWFALPVETQVRAPAWMITMLKIHIQIVMCLLDDISPWKSTSHFVVLSTIFMIINSSDGLFSDKIVPTYFRPATSYWMALGLFDEAGIFTSERMTGHWLSAAHGSKHIWAFRFNAPHHTIWLPWHTLPKTHLNYPLGTMTDYERGVAVELRIYLSSFSCNGNANTLKVATAPHWPHYGALGDFVNSPIRLVPQFAFENNANKSYPTSTQIEVSAHKQVLSRQNVGLN
ncbi:hypothetical protein N7537_010266 [Penicillium hordei]|uniref:Uncharacterized protein n=1 Tax=Penicillium hordei TaxID=40994 RepID=A0AAD6DUI1_9EURO|nr:uncharacterized protein N7537_010266 [Penicillium hordei]KAJ5593362.1 hypothetical protein N7537_010266 [Penicillium hordei]